MQSALAEVEADRSGTFWGITDGGRLFSVDMVNNFNINCLPR